MADRNRELVPDKWSLVRERALTTGLSWEGGILNTVHVSPYATVSPYASVCVRHSGSVALCTCLRT